MDKFQTNAAGNIDSGTEVLANNLVYMQNGTEKLFSDLFGRTFTTGIINTEDANTMFPLTANTDGTFNIGQGIGYIFDTNDNLYKKIAITTVIEYNSANPTQTTDDGTGNAILTPKSSGCNNIPIANNDIEYEIWLEYLQVCENGNTGSGTGLINYSIAKKISSSETDKKRFYQWADGYKVTLKAVTDTSTIQGLCLGTVTKASNNTLTFTDTNRAKNLVINSNVIMDYFVAGSGMTFVERDNKIILSVNVDNITTEIKDNQVKVTKDVLYPYTKFTVNSGNINTNTHKPDILVTDNYGIQLTFGIETETPLTVSPAYNEKYTILPSAQINSIANVRNYIFDYYGETASGAYTVCINNTNKDDNSNDPLENPQLEIMKKIIISETVPTAQKGDIWLDISDEPYHAKWYNGSSWFEYHGVPLGEITIDTTTITINCFDFAVKIGNQIKVQNCIINNDNSTNKNTTLFMDDNGFFNINNTQGVLINNNPIPRLPDYLSKVSNVATSDPGSNDDSSSSHNWTATADGWLQLKREIGTSIGDDAWFKINNQIIFVFASTSTIQVSGFYPIKKGDTVQVRRGFSVDFYPYR